MDVFELHPLPWRVSADCPLSEATPLTIVDASGVPVCAVAAFGLPDDAADPRDWTVANGILAAINPKG